MGKFTGVYEEEGKGGVVTIKIKYSLNGKQIKETLGVKGALINRGGQDERLTPALAALIRADRVTQYARKGEEVLKRNQKVPTLREGWELVKQDMEARELTGLVPWSAYWKSYLEERWGDTPLDQITETDIQAELKLWRTSPKFYTVKRRPPKEATIAQALKILLRIYRLCKARGLYFGHIPVGGGRDKIGTVKIKTSRQLKNKSDRWLTPEEADSILSAAKAADEDLWLQVALSILTGARQTEICGEMKSRVENKAPHHGLRWKDIDWENQTITLLRKGDEVQTIPVDDAVIEILKSVPQGTPNQKVAGPYNKKRAWQRVVRELKLNPPGTERKDRVVWHTLRHTYANWYLQAGGNLKDLSWLLNHKDIQTTALYLTQSLETQKIGNKGVANMMKRGRKAKFAVIGGGK